MSYIGNYQPNLLCLRKCFIRCMITRWSGTSQANKLVRFTQLPYHENKVRLPPLPVLKWYFTINSGRGHFWKGCTVVWTVDNYSQIIRVSVQKHEIDRKLQVRQFYSWVDINNIVRTRGQGYRHIQFGYTVGRKGREIVTLGFGTWCVLW